MQSTFFEFISLLLRHETVKESISYEFFHFSLNFSLSLFDY